MFQIDSQLATPYSVGVGARPGPARPREFATSVGAADVTKVVGVADATKVVGVGEEKRAEEGDGGVWAVRRCRLTAVTSSLTPRVESVCVSTG